MKTWLVEVVFPREYPERQQHAILIARRRNTFMGERLGEA